MADSKQNRESGRRGEASSGVTHGRFTELDGMRGVAALVVVFCHTVIFGLGPIELPFAHLAVDLFFVLSGFVLANAYDERFAAGMNAWTFMVKRWIRLYPEYLLGQLLGLASLLFVAAGIGAKMLVVSTALNLLILPGHKYPFFPLNGPSWSLFFEFWVASLAFGLFWRRLRGAALAAVIFIGAIGLGVNEWRYGTIDAGFNLTGLVGGFARVMFSFFAGIAIARFHTKRPPPFAVPAWVILAIVAAVLCAQVSGSLGSALDMVCVFLLFPAIVYLGAGAKERRPKLGAALGDASYAAYAIHWPLLAIASACAAHYGIRGSAPLQVSLTVAICAAAWILDRSMGKLRKSAPVRNMQEALASGMQVARER